MINKNIEKVIVKKLEGNNQNKAITELSQHLLEKGLVKESFIDAVLEREKVYPTGLPTNSVGVAIPHTDTIHVNKTALAVGMLERPAQFTMMGNDSLIDVEIIFMLAIKEPKGQLSVLQNLMNFFQADDKLGKISKCNDLSEIKNIVELAIFD